MTVPITLQVALLDRVLRYERSFAAESSPVSVLVVMRSSSPESVRVTSQLTAELQRVGALGGRPIEVVTLPYASEDGLRAAIASSSSRLVVLCPGLFDAIDAIQAAAAGSGVIVVSTVGGYVDMGATVGFELRSARPRIAVNLAEARDQRLHFDAQFLRLTRVIE